MTNHMTVAVTVKSGGADVGLGIASCTKAIVLDFIPVGYEAYDFLVTDSFPKRFENHKIYRIVEVRKL